MDHRLTLIETRVLLALLTFRNKTTNLCWPRRAQVAERCGYSVSRISNSISSLGEKGWINTTRSKSGNKYEITVPELGTISKVPEPGTCKVPEPGTSLPLTDKRTDQRTNQYVRARTKDTDNSQFQRFRDCWPKGKWTGGKAKPQEFWKRHRLDEIADIIIADVQARTRDDRKWCEGYVPMPMTYLNQRRWEDDIDTGLSQRNSSALDFREIARQKATEEWMAMTDQNEREEREIEGEVIQ